MSYHDHITSMFANGHLAVMNRLDDVLDRDEDQLHSSIKAFNHEKQPEGSSTGKMECTSGVGAELGQNDIPWHDSRMALESGSMMKKRAVRHSVANMVSTDESHDQSVFSEYRENLERSSRRRSTSLSSSSVFKRNVLQTTFVAVDANTMDPNTYFDDTTPRELLDTLIERLHKQVISDISSHRHLQAEHHLLDTILHLEERYIAYGVPFNDLQEMQNQLAGIYRKQGKDEEASEIIFASLRNRSKPEQTIKAPAMVDAGVTPDNAEQYYQLGLMHLVKYQSNKKLVYLDAAERDAKRAFKCSLKARAVWPEPFIHAVSLLVQVYKDKGKLVHADTYHDLYLQKSKSLSNPPSRPSSHTCLSAISHSSSTSNVINGNENPDNVDHLSIETDPKPGLSGKTTMIEAVETDNRNAIQKLRHGGAQLDHALLDAAKNGKGDITQLLLDLDAPKEMKDESGATPLLIAAKHAHTMIVQQLLDHHTDVNAKDNHGWSVIHYAAHQRSVDMMLMLLRRDYQVDVNATCVDGKTGLHYLAETGNVPTARVLLQHQADAKIKDTTSRTPLDIAIRRRRYDFVDMLLRNNVLTFNPDSLLVTSQEIKNLLGQTKEYLEY
jgi:ankyrin repeat protein